MTVLFPTTDDGAAALPDRPRHRAQRPSEAAEQLLDDRADPPGGDRLGRSWVGGGGRTGDAGPAGWAPPADAAPERTAVALARWQRRRIVRALLGLPLNEIGPRESIRGAVVCGVLLGVVATVVGLTVGAWP